ncbi:hypothetical protein ZIOFF_042027 [Zingiber officinale]|uniref:Uncharacterized protein n=1 Tax=Zingiber officinale TaxID=94328 RepID=A0A8J5GIJ3_ZINOF|nr:hypothetical protein ZIOFF_042027 [Zingiber officinale]
MSRNFCSRGSSCFEDEGKGMGTRQVYEEKLRNGNLQHDPTMSPGLGSARCPRCLSLINPNPEKGGWAITSVLHDAASVAGSGAGGLLSAVHSMNSGIPFIQKHVKGPKWLQFSVGMISTVLSSDLVLPLILWIFPIRFSMKNETLDGSSSSSLENALIYIYEEAFADLFLHFCCIQEPVLYLELTCFRRSVSSVCHHTMPLRVPLAMQYRELQIILKNLIYPSVQEKAS